MYAREGNDGCVCSKQGLSERKGGGEEGMDVDAKNKNRKPEGGCKSRRAYGKTKKRRRERGE